MMHLSTAMDPPPLALTDAHLVAQTLAGDRHAYGQLVERYERVVKATCLATLRDHNSAADAAQDAFIAAYRSLRSLRDPANFAAWLCTIARNRSIRLTKQTRPPAAITDSIASRDPSQPDEDLLSAVAALPEHERIVVMLKYFDRHDVAAIAAMLGRPIGTITKQLSRAHERLRRALSEEKQP